MKSINTVRVLLGGLLAAVVLFIAGGIIHGAILGAKWTEWQKAMGALNHAPSMGAGMVLWAVVSLVVGIAGVWVYAAIRPRFGAGPKTALLAGGIVWVIGSMAPSLGQMALGAYPDDVTVIGCIGFLVADLLAILAGAAPYKEK